MKHPAIQQYHYHQWANNRVLELMRELPDKVNSHPLKSVFFSIQDVIIHMYQADGMWLRVMSGDDFSQTMTIIKQLQEESSGQTLTEMERLYEEMNRSYETFLIGNKSLDKPVEIKHPQFGELETTITEIVTHVVNHGTYHRGNIAAMFRQQGQAGVSMDYIIYLYDMKS